MSPGLTSDGCTHRHVCVLLIDVHRSIMISSVISDRRQEKQTSSSSIIFSLCFVFFLISETREKTPPQIFMFKKTQKDNHSWVPVIPEEHSGIWAVNQYGLKIDGLNGQWNAFLFHEQQIIFKWKLHYRTPRASSRNTQIPVTREIFCFSIFCRLTSRWSFVNLRSSSVSLSRADGVDWNLYVNMEQQQSAKKTRSNWN